MPKTKTPENYAITLIGVIGDKNQISEDVFDFMISYLPCPEKSIRSELAKLFSISIYTTNMGNITCVGQLLPSSCHYPTSAIKCNMQRPGHPSRH